MKTLKKLDDKLEVLKTERAELKAQRRGLVAAIQGFESECATAGAMGVGAMLRLSEIRSELDALDRRLQWLSESEFAVIVERRRVIDAVATAEDILHELPALAGTRREVQEIGELRRRAERVIERAEG